MVVTGERTVTIVKQRSSMVAFCSVGNSATWRRVLSCPLVRAFGRAGAIRLCVLIISRVPAHSCGSFLKALLSKLGGLFKGEKNTRLCKYTPNYKIHYFTNWEVMYYNKTVNIEARSCSHCCRGRVIIIAYSECVFVVLIIQNAKRVCRVIFSSVACFVIILWPA